MRKQLYFTAVLLATLLLSACDNDSQDSNASMAETNISYTTSSPLNETEEAYFENWGGITSSGMDEEVFLQSMNEDILVNIATEFQDLTEEITKKQEEDPESVLIGDWTTDILQSEHYKCVTDLGAKAMKPLYYIIYKSENQGLYEYICSLALEEISGESFTNEEGTNEWSTSKEFLEVFTKRILE